MSFYVLLSASTLIIASLAWAIWRKTKSVSFVIGIGFLYYWSLFGAWFLVTDKLGHDSGMHYYYVEGQLFTIFLDRYYLWTLILYGLFIIIVELVLLALARNVSTPAFEEPATFELSHLRILTIASLAGICSYLIVRDSLAAAAASNIAAYKGTRPEFVEVPALFTWHQELNRVALVPSVLGLVAWCSGKKGRLISCRSQKWALFGYVIVLGTMCLFSLVLGNKNELLFAGLTGLFFYLANSPKPRFVLLASSGVCGAVGLGLVDLLRGVPLPEIFAALKDVGISELGQSLWFFVTSNEAFGAHFSMYGVLANHVPLTYGSSLVSLVASVVPQLFWPGRPGPIYDYYAGSVSANLGEGYTILHTTAWYLNFGTLGVIGGAIVLGWVWAKCFSAYSSIRARTPSWSYALRVIAPWTFVAYLPSFLRGGMESYKGLLLEAFLIPSIVLAVAFKSARDSAVVDSNKARKTLVRAVPSQPIKM
jgi:hypothetical protein